MDLLILAMIVAIGTYQLKSAYQRRRIALLGSHLAHYQIEKLMETLTEGYMRALAERDPERQAQIWGLLSGPEAALGEQFRRFANDFARLDPSQTRVSRWPLPLPYADRLMPSASFDLRGLLQLHAQGIARGVRNEEGLPVKARAYRLLAEVFLMQHSCHWFCRSKATASARLLARHHTAYAQVLDGVSPGTREAYRALVGL